MAVTTAVVRQQDAQNQPPINSGPPFGHLPDHTELPEENGSFVQNFHEHHQRVLLTETLWPILEGLHPDGQFAIGQDSGIYWRIVEPREKGAIAPDWFYVPDVPPLINGAIRRSYVMWQEYIAPFVVMEFISATDGGERDRTPSEGKFWIYEKVIRPAFYVIYDADQGLVDVYHLIEGRFQPIAPNERKHFPIPQLGIEIGIWRGVYKNMNLPWLRIWDTEGNLLPTPEERAKQEAQRAERLAAKLRELGIDPAEL